MAQFKKITIPLSNGFLFEPFAYEDKRGFFMETYNRRDLSTLGLTEEFVQDNHSKSIKGVLRGLHFQTRHAQGKLVRVIRGRVFDVIVDLDRSSNTYLNWFGVELSADNRRMLYIPPGFAHGFLTLEDETEFLYKATDYYYPQFESGIRYDDPMLNIQWPEMDVPIILSDKDKALGTIEQNDLAGIAF